jgi:hypothetical protein
MTYIINWSSFIIQAGCTFYIVYRNFYFKHLKHIIPAVIFIFILMFMNLIKALNLFKINNKVYIISACLFVLFIIINTVVKHKKILK